MRKSAPFQITGKLRYINADNNFKQVQKAYLALISYLDKLVQPGYTLSVLISSLTTLWACYSGVLRHGSSGQDLANY